MTQDHKDKIGAANKGKVRTPEMKARVSETKKGIPLTAEHKANISIALKNRKKETE